MMAATFEHDCGKAKKKLTRIEHASYPKVEVLLPGQMKLSDQCQDCKHVLENGKNRTRSWCCGVCVMEVRAEVQSTSMSLRLTEYVEHKALHGAGSDERVSVGEAEAL